MASHPARSTRGDRALSRERVVASAIDVLDEAGEPGLTFRVLSERLATGPGAIYWHVANRSELLAAATDVVVAAALTVEPDDRPSAAIPGRGRPAGPSAPAERIRAIALRLFDAIERHPWVAAQLGDTAWQPVAPRILEMFGRQVAALGVPRDHRFRVTSVLVEYVLGSAAHNVANARLVGPDVNRAQYLAAVAERWDGLDAEQFGSARAMAAQMRVHDDRTEFLAGIDVILAGVCSVYGLDDPNRAKRAR